MKITFKNGKQATLQRIRAKDYEDFVGVFFGQFNRFCCSDYELLVPREGLRYVMLSIFF